MTKSDKILLAIHYEWSENWDVIEETLGKPILVTYRGGKVGGGGAKLTQTGKELLEAYLKFKSALNQKFSDFDLVEL